jgi:hypothetical protein
MENNNYYIYQPKIHHPHLYYKDICGGIIQNIHGILYEDIRTTFDVNMSIVDYKNTIKTNIETYDY